MHETSTRSPGTTVVTAAPTSTTVPTASWPRIVPGFTSGTSPLRMCRSVPQIVDESIRTIASVGSRMVGSGTDSQARFPGPWYTRAFISSSFRCLDSAPARARRHRRTRGASLRVFRTRGADRAARRGRTRRARRRARWSASLRPACATPTATATPAARLASRPSTVVSKVAASPGSRPSSRQAVMIVSGAGLLSRPPFRITLPSTIPSNRGARPARSSISSVFALAEITAHLMPASRASSRYWTVPSNAWIPARSSRRWKACAFRFARPNTVSLTGESSGRPSGSLIPRLARNACRPDDPRLAVEVAVVVAAGAERAERAEPLAGELQPPRQELVEAVPPGCRVDLGARRQDPVEVEDAGPHAVRQSECPCRRSRPRKAVMERNALLLRDRLEQPRGLDALDRKASPERAELVVAQAASAARARGEQRILGREEREPPVDAQLVECPRRCIWARVHLVPSLVRPGALAIGARSEPGCGFPVAAIRGAPDDLFGPRGDDAGQKKATSSRGDAPWAPTSWE